jgi:paraquat-inducible protein B
MDVTLSAEGITVDTESLASLLTGGLAFTTPPFAQTSATAPQGSAFKLYGTRAEAMREPDGEGHQYVVVFNESVRGLKPGAPVEFRGIPVGEVTEIRTRYVRTKERIQVPVTLTLYPERLQRRNANKAPLGAPELRAILDQLVAGGLRAQLRAGNLLTGQLYVALDFIDDVPPAKILWSASPPELPTAKGQLAELEATVTSIAKKLDALPYDQLVAEVRTAIASLDATLKTTQALAKKLGDDVAPDVQTTLADTRSTLASARYTLASDNALQVELQTTLREVSAAARALKDLAETLERRPESVLRGKPEVTGEKP